MPRTRAKRIREQLANHGADSLSASQMAHLAHWGITPKRHKRPKTGPRNKDAAIARIRVMRVEIGQGAAKTKYQRATPNCRCRLKVYLRGEHAGQPILDDAGHYQYHICELCNRAMLSASGLAPCGALRVNRRAGLAYKYLETHTGFAPLDARAKSVSVRPLPTKRETEQGERIESKMRDAKWSSREKQLHNKRKPKMQHKYPLTAAQFCDREQETTRIAQSLDIPSGEANHGRIVAIRDAGTRKSPTQSATRSTRITLHTAKTKSTDESDSALIRAFSDSAPYRVGASVPRHEQPQRTHAQRKTR